MNGSQFRIAVTGDTGYDYYTQYVEGFESKDHRVRKPVGACDMYVPSGAAFTAQALESLLLTGPEPRLSIEHLRPANAHSGPPPGKVFSTLQKQLVELDLFKNHHAHDQGAVLRVKQTRPIRDKDQVKTQKEFDHLVGHDPKRENKLDYDLLVIHDGAGSWRRYPDESSPGAAPKDGSAMQLVNHVLNQEVKDNPWPRVIVNLNHDLPDVERSADGSLTFSRDLTFWQKLAEADHVGKVCVVCSANMLRSQGAAISRRLSWEQTVEDLATDLLIFDKLKMLSRFKHLVIRLGMVAAVHIETDGRMRKADLVYAPLARTGFYRDPVEDGTLEGQNAVLTAALAKMIAFPAATQKPREAFVGALKSGLLACMRAFDHGYRAPWTKGRKITWKSGANLIKKLFKCGANRSAANAIDKGYEQAISERNQVARDQTLGHAAIPCDILDNPPGSWSARRPNWELLRSAINPPGEALVSEDRREKIRTTATRINIGVAIVLFGQDRVLNQSELQRPSRKEEGAAPAEPHAAEKRAQQEPRPSHQLPVQTASKRLSGKPVYP